MRSRILYALLIALTLSTKVGAVTDLGYTGKVYPVTEPDFMKGIPQKIARQWARTQKEQQQKLETYKPPDLHHLPKATRDRTVAVDMTYVLEHGLLDRNGKVIYPKGYTYNPLNYMRLNTGLVVIDGSDPAQVEWFDNSPYSENHRINLLLSDGSAERLSGKLGRPVYYLGEDVAQRLQLTAVPCIAVQKGEQMEVTEFLIEEEE